MRLLTRMPSQWLCLLLASAAFAHRSKADVDVEAADGLGRPSCMLGTMRYHVRYCDHSTPSPPSVSVAAAGIDPSIDGQSGISEIGSQKPGPCTAHTSARMSRAVQRGLIYSYMQSRRPPQPNRSIGGGLGSGRSEPTRTADQKILKSAQHFRSVMQTAKGASVSTQPAVSLSQEVSAGRCYSRQPAADHES